METITVRMTNYIRTALSSQVPRGRQSEFQWDVRQEKLTLKARGWVQDRILKETVRGRWGSWGLEPVIRKTVFT